MDKLGAMTAAKFLNLLRRLDACSEAMRWARGKDLAEAWKTCPRGDWLLWLAGRMAGEPEWPSRQEVVLAACDCAEPPQIVLVPWKAEKDG